MSRHPLLAVGLVSSLLGGIVSGCSDPGTAASSAGANSSTNGAESTVSKVGNATTGAEQVAAPAVSAATGGGADFASAWGPAVGTTIPLLAATDHTGAAQNLASLTGSKGLLLVFSRSADW